MKFLTGLFLEKCPNCEKVLITNQSNSLLSHVVKACPQEHYTKEFHPALETYVEYNDGSNQ